jgi:hypothetical protein
VRSRGFAWACWACLLGCGRVTSDDGLRTKAGPDGSVVLHPDAALLSDGSPARSSDAPACTNGCLFGATVCTPDDLGVQTCGLQTTGCTAWSPVVACSPHELCQGIMTPYGSSALCTCDTSTCMAAGPSCDANGDLVVCAVDDHGCYYEASITPCTAPNVCFYTACNPGLADAVCRPTCEGACLSDAGTGVGCGAVPPDAGCGCPGWSLCQVCAP